MYWLNCHLPLISFLLLKQSSSVQIGMGFLCILMIYCIAFSQWLVLIKPLLQGKILVLGLIYLFLDTNMVAIHFLDPYWLQGSGLELPQSEKLRRLVLAGIAALVGYIATFFTPVIKRISTTSFVMLLDFSCINFFIGL